MSDVRLVGKIDSRKLVPCFNENNRIPANMIMITALYTL